MDGTVAALFKKDATKAIPAGLPATLKEERELTSRIADALREVRGEEDQEPRAG